MKEQSNSNIILTVVILTILLFIGFVYEFGAFFNLDFDTSLEVIKRLFVSALFVISASVFLKVPILQLWPYLALGAWISFFPALDHWSLIYASQSDPNDIYGLEESYRTIEQGTLWYSALYTKLGVSILILLIGHYVKNLFK